MSIDVNVQNDLVIVTESSEDITVNVSNAAGPQGPAGPAGQGVPVGGSTGQVLKKLSNTNYDTYWALDGGGVPYTGATGDVDLGEYELKAGQVEFDQTPTGVAGVGVMRWNDSDGTVDLGLKGGNVTLQIGQEQVIRVVNKTGANLLESQYKVCRVRTQAEGGAQGQRLAVVLAQANTKANHTGVLGVVTENINNNQEGFITNFGNVQSINTTGSLQGETWVDGDIIWLSETVAGGLTNIEPSTHPVQIGYIVYAHANNGKIFISLEAGVDELNELHDVNTTGVTNGQVLAYDGVDGVWKPSTNASGNIYTTNGTLTGNRTVTMGSYTLTFEKNLIVNNATVGTINSDTVLGYNALRNTLGGSNTGVGDRALSENTSGASNVGVGKFSLFYNEVGNSNVGVGNSSLFDNTGSNNVAIGADAGWGAVKHTTGSNNIFIGYQSSGVLATTSNRTWIGNDSTESTWLGGNLLLGTKTNSGYLLDVNGNGRMNQLLLTTINNATTDTDKFLVSDSGVIKYRTGTEILSDIGAFVLPSLTSGSVLFSNGTTLSQDNTNFFWDNTNKRLGIGTNAPTDVLDIRKNQVSTSVATTTSMLLSNTNASGIAAYVFTSDGTTRQGGLQYNNTTGFRNLFSCTYTDIPYYFGTNNLIRLTITGSTGNILINTTTDSGQRLQVQGTTLLNGNVTINGSAATTTTTGLRVTNSNPNVPSLLVSNNNVAGFYTSLPTYTSANDAHLWIGLSLILSSSQGGASGGLANNIFWNGSALIRKTSGFVSGFTLNEFGNILLNTAGTGAAGSSITDYTTKLQVFNNGNIVIQNGGTFTDNGASLQVNSSVTAASAIARGVNVTSTLVAAANNDVLVGLDVNPTFTNGAFTGVSNLAARFSPSILINGTASSEANIAFNGLNTNFSSALTFRRNGSNRFSFGYTESASTPRFFIYSDTVDRDIIKVYNATGNLAIGNSPFQNTDAGFRLDVNGTARVSGATTFGGALLLTGATGATVGSISLDSVNGLTLSAKTGSTYDFVVYDKNGVRAISFGTSGFVSSAGTYGGIKIGLSGPQSLYYDATYGLGVTGSGTQNDAGLFERSGLNFAGINSSGNFRVGAYNSTFNSSAILEAVSTTKGFLPPRGNNAQMLAIASPATGLIFYDTTNNKLNCYDGTTWQACW